MKLDVRAASSKWYLYLLAAGILSFSVAWGVSIRCKPSAEERLRYFILSYGVNGDALVSKTQETVPELREVKLHFQSLDQDTAAKKLFTYVYESVDFYVVPESWMPLASGYSCHFDESTIHAAIPSSAALSLYAFEGRYSGIRIYDAASSSGKATQYFTYTEEGKTPENFYLCFPASSSQSGTLGGKTLDYALRVAEALIA